MNYKYLFGPVPSRRLGVSLGVDLVPHKVCSLDCIYCEVGKTTNLTAERKEYISVHEVIRELDDYLGKNPKLDFITFSGQGEPILNSGIGEIIKHIKEIYPQYKLALITNSTLFGNKDLRNEILPVDLVLPSLDAVSQDIFEKINRPAENISINEIITGLIEFKKKYKGEMWLEIFIIPGLNDQSEEILKMKNILEEINPDLVQLNSLDRPGTENWVKKASKQRLEEIESAFNSLNTKIIAKYKTRTNIESFDKNISKQILNTIQRRPCTADDLVEMLGKNKNEINKYLNELLDSGKIRSLTQERGVFFQPVKE